MTQTGMVAGGVLTDWVSLGVLASRVPRDAVDEAVAETGRKAKRAGGKLPPHVTVYFVMALALFPDDDYEEVAVRLTEALRSWGCWEEAWEPPTKGAVTQARQRLGPGPLAALFGLVAVPPAGLDTAGAFLGPWRLMSVDGMEWDLPDTEANAAEFTRRAGGGGALAAFPKARVITVSECGSHAPVLAAVGRGGGGKATGEQTLARDLYPRLEEGWLLLADRNFYCFADWCTAADAGADLLWRVVSNTRLPVLEELPDGSFRTVLVNPAAGPRERERLIAAARDGHDLDPGRGRPARAVVYDVPDRAGNGKDETIILVTTITDWQAAPALELAAAYHQRWEHETGNQQVKTYLRGPGRVLRSGSPELAEQEIWGYLLAHYAVAALICDAATAAGIDPDRVKFKRTLRIIRRAVGPAFPP